MIFTRSFFVRWGDVDFNGHMANTAFLDLAVDVRFMYFEECGVSLREMERMRIGPVILKDEVEYRRELRLLQRVEVSLQLAGLAEDGSRFRYRNVFLRDDGELAVKLTTTAGWMSLDERRLIVPPRPILEAMRSLERTEDFESLPSSMRD